MDKIVYMYQGRCSCVYLWYIFMVYIYGIYVCAGLCGPLEIGWWSFCGISLVDHHWHNGSDLLGIKSVLSDDGGLLAIG